MFERFMKYVEEKNSKLMIKQIFKQFEKAKEHDVKAGWYKELYRLHKNDEIMSEIAKTNHSYHSNLARLHLEFMTKWYNNYIDYVKKIVNRRTKA